jgi:hypothetical protein
MRNPIVFPNVDVLIIFYFSTSSSFDDQFSMTNTFPHVTRRMTNGGFSYTFIWEYLAFKASRYEGKRG